eukprot:m.23945 g.23945  ORF g.23945 m.23945 type:complete len:377 (+) comp14421_c0_seq1:209-1339(+)
MMKLHTVVFAVIGLACATNATIEEDRIEFLEQYAAKESTISMESGVMYTIVNRGDPTGKSPSVWTPCRIHYTGKLHTGMIFDGTDPERGPKSLTPKHLIPGLSETIPMMKEGDKWEIVIPSELAYGDYEKGAIPRNSVLVFDMDLLEVGNEPSSLSVYADLIFRRYPMAIIFTVFVIYKFIGWFLGINAPSGPRYNAKILQSVMNPRVFLDIAIGGKHKGTIEIELFPKVVPKTVENFTSLCLGNVVVDKKRLAYKGSNFHRIIPDFMIQGGDFTKGDGTGGRCVFEKPKFNDEFENGYIVHEPFAVSMANSGANTNGSQFFITLKTCEHLDGKHVVFGTVVGGKDVVKAIETNGSAVGAPPVIITKAGEIRKKST